jgi:hypothetical protein
MAFEITYEKSPSAYDRAEVDGLLRAVTEGTEEV